MSKIKKRHSIVALMVIMIAAISLSLCGCRTTTSTPGDKEEEKENIVLRFAVMSDIHYNATSKKEERKRFPKAIKVATSLADDKLDALVINGDFSEGRESEYDDIITDYNANKAGATKLITIRGNHDGTSVDFQKKFGHKLDTAFDVQGYRFITISSAGDKHNAAQNTWLNAVLKQMTEQEPQKPVFVFIHKPPKETVWNSGVNMPESFSTDLFTETLNKYPQAIVIAGHLHNTLENDRVMYQDKFTAYQNSTLHKFFIDSPHMDDTAMDGGDVPPNADTTGGQFSMVEVNDENVVKIKRYGIYDNRDDVKKIGRDFVIDVKAGSDAFLYTSNKMFANSVKPTFSDDTLVTLNSSASGMLQIKFKQAMCETVVYYYAIEIIDNDKTIKKFNTTSNFYFYEMPPVLDYTFKFTGDVSSGKQYKVKITGVNTAEQKSDIFEKIVTIA